MRWYINLERVSKNKLNPNTTRNKLKDLAISVGSHTSLGFQAKPCKLKEPKRVFDGQQERYQYQARIHVTRNGTTIRSEHLDFLLGDVERRAKQAGWEVKGISPVETIGVSSSPEDRPSFHLPELTHVAVKGYFDHIHERDAHIRLIHDCVRAYVRSGRQVRSHVLLHGKPAACKTTLFEAFKEFYEQDGIQRVVFIDGPTLTKAGLENWLLELAEQNTLPEIICIEEIEKQNMDNLLTLLSMMASGYIRKTNARVGRLQMLAESMIWATCNDAKRIKSFRDGAIWSRFTHRFYCTRPSPGVVEKILRRKAEERNGASEWVDAVMKFAYETYPDEFGNPLDDPREIIGLLDGEDRLLDGTYQADKLEIFRLEMNEEKDDVWSQASLN